MQSLDVNTMSSLISAGAALFGAVIGALATIAATWVNKKVQQSGTVSLYVKMVYAKGSLQRPWGYYSGNANGGLTMHVPLWLDVCNTCGVSRIVRNISLFAYTGKEEVAEFTQIQRIGNGENAILMGDNEAYTLVVPANSARRFDLLFSLQEKELPTDNKIFTDLILTYYDETDGIHSFFLAKPSRCWVEGSLEFQKKWVSLDKKHQFSIH